jgi:hypothetical protein
LGGDRIPGILPVLPDDRIADEPQAALPLCDLAPGCVPLGQGILVLDLVSEAEHRDGIAYGHRSLVCFEALVAAPEHESGKVIDAGHEELPRGAGGMTTFIKDGTRPTGEGAGS